MSPKGRKPKNIMADLNYENRKLPNMEELDVVDENDKIIDSRPRAEVHQLGLLHREINIWMFDKDKNIFFQKRGLHTSGAGLLNATIGGHVDKGENYLEAAVRETKEETGISIRPEDLVLLRMFRGQKSSRSEDNAWKRINNFNRAIYIYQNPIKENQIVKEAKIPGGGFQKLAPALLLNPEKDFSDMFQMFVLAEEIPYVLKYLKLK
jgi:isopentenyldiphosphate isomerase